MKQFTLKFLWLNKSIAVGLDQKMGERSTPLTEFFFWPQTDAWEEIRIYLENNTWIGENNSILLLNQVTEVINEWQDKSESSNNDLSSLKKKFPNCLFVGYE